MVIICVCAHCCSLRVNFITATLLNIFIVWVSFIKFSSILFCHLQLEIVVFLLFPFFASNWFLFTLASTSSTLLNSSWRQRASLSCYWPQWECLTEFPHLSKCLSIFIFWWVFIRNVCCLFSEVFFSIYWDNHFVFLLRLINTVNYINRFYKIELSYFLA